MSHFTFPFRVTLRAETKTASSRYRSQHDKENLEMLRKFPGTLTLIAVFTGLSATASHFRESEVRDFITRWNAAYTSLDAVGLAALETPDFELVDRFGHWIKSTGP